jgi:hypothetical protein
MAGPQHLLPLARTEIKGFFFRAEMGEYPAVLLLKAAPQKPRTESMRKF